MSDRAAQIRESFPQCVAVADRFRDVFGASVKITHAVEGDNKIGCPLDESRYIVIAGPDLILNKPQKGGRDGR